MNSRPSCQAYHTGQSFDPIGKCFTFDNAAFLIFFKLFYVDNELANGVYHGIMPESGGNIGGGGNGVGGGFGEFRGGGFGGGKELHLYHLCISL